MAKSSQIKMILWLHVLATWSAVAYAAEVVTLSQGLTSIPLSDAWTVLFLAAFGGITSTLIRLAKQGSPPIANLTMEIIRDTFASLMAGFFGFLVTMWAQEVGYFPTAYAWPQAIAILAAGFSGSRFLERVIHEGAMTWLSKVIEWFTGRLPGPPPQQ